MLTAIRLSGLRPPELEIDERTMRAFPELAERVRQWNNAHLEWWRKVAVMLDVGASSGDASAISDLNLQLTAITSEVSRISAALASSAAGSASSDPASASSASTVTAAASGALHTTSAQLIEWTQQESFRILSANVNDSGHLKTAAIRWPDGSLGRFTTLAHNTTHLAVDSYEITHPASGRRVYQPAVVRDSNGSIKTAPNLVVL